MYLKICLSNGTDSKWVDLSKNPNLKNISDLFGASFGFFPNKEWKDKSTSHVPWQVHITRMPMHKLAGP